MSVDPIGGGGGGGGLSVSVCLFTVFVSNYSSLYLQTWIHYEAQMSKLTLGMLMKGGRGIN